MFDTPSFPAHSRNILTARKAFSLIELLTVVAITAILVSIILVAVPAIRGRSAATRCASNLRQIGMAVSMYAGENQGRFPMGLEDGNSSFDNNWMPTLSLYLGKNELPRNWNEYRELVVSEPYLSPFYTKTEASGGSYRMNWRLQRNGSNTPLTFDSVPLPTRTLMFVLNPGHPVFNLATQARFPNAGTANCLFVDGHIETLTLQGLLEREANGEPMVRFE